MFSIHAFQLLILLSLFLLIAAALDPKALYTSKIVRKPRVQHAVTLAINKVARSPSKASAANDQYTIFKRQGGLFGGEAARRSALKGNISAGNCYSIFCNVLMSSFTRIPLDVAYSIYCHFSADWWDQYGGDCPELQAVARCIVSPCMSSSGCERNWSTFALVHTKLRNRLGYEKLHKLVYVHYNLKLRIQNFEVDMRTLQEMKNCKEKENDPDPCSIIIDVTLYDEGNPVLDWLCKSRSEAMPTLDEFDDIDPESPNNPGKFLIEELGMDKEEVNTFREKIDFRKKCGKKRKKGFEEEDLLDGSESDSDQQGSPTYAESGDSSSANSEGNGQF